MRKFLFVFVVMLFTSLPCVLCAEELEIQLTEVVGMSVLPGESPLDGNDHMPSTPPCPSCFRATINGHSLAITKQETAIPSAQAIVVNASTGSPVINEPFTNSISRQIANSGVYVLRIETAGGALVGQFVIQ